VSGTMHTEQAAAGGAAANAATGGDTPMPGTASPGTSVPGATAPEPASHAGARGTGQQMSWHMPEWVHPYVDQEGPGRGWRIRYQRRVIVSDFPRRWSPVSRRRWRCIAAYPTCVLRC
jgi:hypothetical protein